MAIVAILLILTFMYWHIMVLHMPDSGVDVKNGENGDE